MKTKLLTLCLLGFVYLSTAQFKTNLRRNDFEIKSKEVTAFKETYVTYVKEFSNEYAYNATFNSDGYVTSNRNYSKITYQNSYEKVTQISRKDNKVYTNFLIKTPIATYLADTKQVKTNAKGQIVDIFFKSEDGKYDSNLEITYNNNLITTKPTLDYLYVNVYTEKGLLVKELNKSMGNYYNAYDSKTNLQSIRVFSMGTDSKTDLYMIYTYEFDSFGNWIVKYEYQSAPNYGSKLDNLKRIEVREYTHKNGTKTGYSSVNQEIKNKGLAKIKTLNVEKLDKGNFPVYYDYKEKAIANSTTNSKCEGDCQNGWGKYTYDNGLYEGFWQNGLKTGYGMYAWNNGDLYCGNWYLDKISGYGSTSFANGNGYDGGFLNGQHHGNAMFYNKETKKMEHNAYVNGKFFQAINFRSTGNTTGCVNGDCNNGYGHYKFSNGDAFTGDFKNYKLNKGVYYFSNGDIYMGNFNQNNQFEGYGLYSFKATDDIYSGNWINGKRNGRGYAETNKIAQKGEWKDGVLVIKM